LGRYAAPSIRSRIHNFESYLGVETLLKVYAKCIDGQRDAINRLIEEALDGDE
jgi:hypothetical protein